MDTFVTSDVKLNEDLSREGAKLIDIKTIKQASGITTGRLAQKQYTFINDDEFKSILKKVQGAGKEEVKEEVKEDSPVPKKGKAKK